MLSTTLQPQQFYAEMRGLPHNTAWLEVGAPFDASQLDVRVVSHIRRWTGWTLTESSLQRGTSSRTFCWQEAKGFLHCPLPTATHTWKRKTPV
ncbi:hypothetical protein [Methylibium rhizosphaerae]|uniref:hypothetical protein n=1 Tax=Methylibium rhizosphaerae TaxID=2570323 RepID=UPI001126FC74|nr:hypothetical protein [Methylibium rhizosphaerae]